MKGIRDASSVQIISGAIGDVSKAAVAQDVVAISVAAHQRGSATGESADFALLY